MGENRDMILIDSTTHQILKLMQVSGVAEMLDFSTRLWDLTKDNIGISLHDRKEDETYWLTQDENGVKTTVDIRYDAKKHSDDVFIRTVLGESYALRINGKRATLTHVPGLAQKDQEETVVRFKMGEHVDGTTFIRSMQVDRYPEYGDEE